MPTYTHFVITNANEQEIKNIKNTLDTDVRCKSLRITSPCRTTGYIKITDESQINDLATEFLQKFTTCSKEDISFTPPIPLRHFSLPDDKLRIKKFQNIAKPTGAGYGSRVVAGLGTNVHLINMDVFYNAFLAAGFPALIAFFVKIRQGYD